MDTLQRIRFEANERYRESQRRAEMRFLGFIACVVSFLTFLAMAAFVAFVVLRYMGKL